MAQELYINNTMVDLLDKSISQTLQVNDIADIKDRNAHSTNNIKIPKTAKNILTFKMLGITGSTTRLPYEDLFIKYIDDGVELITSGKGIVKNTNKYFNLIIYDGNISMKDLLGDSRMDELDYSTLNHFLTQSGFTNSFTNTSGYIYSLGEFYTGSTESEIIMNLITPCIFMHTLFDMIFDEKGWSASGSFLNNADFKDRLIAPTKGYDRLPIQNELLRQTFDASTLGEFSETYGVIETQTEFDIDSYTSITTITHTIRMSGVYEGTFGTDANIIIRKNGIEVRSISVIQVDGFNENVILSIGDLLSIHVRVNSESDGGTETIQFTANWIDTIFENDIEVVVKFEDLMGDTTQSDFVKDIMQRFGLFFSTNFQDKVFTFTRISDVLSNKALSENWSDKYVSFADEKYKPNYAQTNTIKYLYDKNDTNTDETYADGEIIVDNVNLKPNKTLFTSIFKASTFTNSGYWTLNHWVDEEEEIVPNNDGLRMFKDVKINAHFYYKYQNGDFALNLYTGLFSVLNFDKIFYQKEIDNNYQEFNNLLNSYSEITLLLNLSISDILTVDFLKLKYFKQLGQYYYMNKIIGFKSKKLTKVQFIQIGDDITVFAVFDTSTTTGESVVSSTLTKNTIGQMDATTTGESVVNATLTKTGVVLTSFTTSTTGANLSNVCDKEEDITRYHDGAGTFPVVNDFVFEDSGGMNPFNGADKYYKYDGFKNLKINFVGKVTEANVCT